MWQGENEEALKAFSSCASALPGDHECVVQALSLLRRLGRDEERFAMADAAVERGALLHRYQAPGQLVRSLPALPWHDVSTWRIRRVLRSNFEQIKQELTQVLYAGTLEREGKVDTENLTEQGLWTELNLFFQGRTWEKNCALVPFTSNLLLRQLPEAISQALIVDVWPPGMDEDARLLSLEDSPDMLQRYLYHRNRYKEAGSDWF